MTANCVFFSTASMQTVGDGRRGGRECQPVIAKERGRLRICEGKRKATKEKGNTTCAVFLNVIHRSLTLHLKRLLSSVKHSSISSMGRFHFTIRYSCVSVSNSSAPVRWDGYTVPCAGTPSWVIQSTDTRLVLRIQQISKQEQRFTRGFKEGFEIPFGWKRINLTQAKGRSITISKLAKLWHSDGGTRKFAAAAGTASTGKGVFGAWRFSGLKFKLRV